MSEIAAPKGEPAAYEALRGLGARAVEAGRFDDAEEAFSAALAWARETDDRRLVDNALCALAAVAIPLGSGESHLPTLRQILMRNEDLANCRLAAYNISLHYERTKEYKKSLFYARIALDRSHLIGRPDWMASSHNQVGNTLLGESQVESASREYELALALMPVEPSAARAGILDNLGYCRLLQGRFADGYALLYQSLALVRRLGADRYETFTRLDLCFAHLETGRLRHARRQGERALVLAERLGELPAIKNALYLLGEAANLSGDVDAARGHFDRLQREFFPEVDYLPGFLLAVDVRKLINLHA